MMGENFGLDAILDIKNEDYRHELESLFRSCAVNPINSDGDNALEKIHELSQLGVRQALYVADKIDPEIMSAINNNAGIRLDNLLLVDDETKSEICNSTHLTDFNHVLSCNQKHVPHLQIMSTVRKIREQKFFGVDKVVAYGAYVHNYVLSHSDQRQWFRDSLYEFVKGLSTVLNRPTDAYAQYAVEVQEELLMNSIWDANPKLKDVDRRIPVALPPHDTVQVEWSFDGTHLAIGVRDPFGTFEANVINKYLKFLFARDKKTMIRMRQEGAGAGLGLFMVLERLSSLIINVAPGKTTEVVALRKTKVSI